MCPLVKLFRLSDFSSVFTAELVAILKILQFFEDRPPFQLAIFSDSLSALQAIENGDSSSDVVKEILYQLYMYASQGIVFNFIWIPSHVNILGNEMADKFAKQGLKRENVDFALVPDVFDLSDQVLDIIMAKWQEDWSSNSKGRFYFNIEPETWK